MLSEAIPESVISAIFARHGVTGDWGPLPATGVANHIYATESVVLRIATDHPDGVSDARTESVAAPVARAAGIRTPALLAFDDSSAIIAPPYTLWERVHGETVGLLAQRQGLPLSLWSEVGEELAKLHTRVTECPDPNGWLDDHGDYGDPREHCAASAAAGSLPPETRAFFERWLEILVPAMAERPADRFIHGDMHAINLMCTGRGSLLAFIDWGDAGCADPAIEFTDLPSDALPTVVAAYRDAAPSMLGATGEGRILWYRLARHLKRVADGNPGAARLDELMTFARDAKEPWRAFC